MTTDNLKALADWLGDPKQDRYVVIKASSEPDVLAVECLKFRDHRKESTP